jgi:MADS-box transcription factor
MKQFVGPSGDTSWLEFLSHNAPQPNGQQLHMTLPPANPRDGLSWERDREIDHYNLSERGGGGDKGAVNGTGHVSPQSRKRPRASSGVDEGRRPSPTARAATGIVKDRMDPSNNTIGQPGKEE